MTLIDSATAAAALGITERTVRRLVTRGKFTNHGTPRAILIDLEQILEDSRCRCVRI